MALLHTCRQCGRRYELPESLGGRRGRCVCGAQFEIPQPLAPPDECPQSVITQSSLASSPLPTVPAPAPADTLTGADTPKLRPLAWWRTLSPLPRLLCLTVPLALVLAVLLWLRFPNREQSLALPGSVPLTAWSWLLCPLLGLLMLRLVTPRETLTPRVLLTGLFAGAGWALWWRLLASLVFYLPLAVRANLAVNWGNILFVSVVGMVIGAPWLAYWSARQERASAGPPRWLTLLWRLGDSDANPAFNGTVAFVWALSALALLYLLGLFRTRPNEVGSPQNLMALLIALGAITTVTVLSLLAAGLTSHNRFGPYALTGAYCGALTALIVSVSLWRPGLALVFSGLSLLVLATALGGFLGLLIHRGAALGSSTFDLAAACAIGLAVIIFGFAMTPSLQTNSIISLAREGRKVRLVTEAIGRLRGASGVRSLLEISELPRQAQLMPMMGMPSSSPSPPPEPIPNLNLLTQAADKRLLELGTTEPMLLISCLPSLNHSRRIFLIAHLVKAQEPRLVPELLKILDGKLPPPPLPKPPKPNRLPNRLPTPSLLSRLRSLPYFHQLRPQPTSSATYGSGYTITSYSSLSSIVPLPLDYGGPEGVQAAAATVLGKLGDRRAVPPLIAALRLKPPLSAAAAAALVELKDPAASEPLRQALMSEDQATRRAAAQGMGVLRYRAAVPELLTLLRTEQEGRREIVTALAALGAREAIPQLKTLLATSEEDSLTQTCCEALEQLGVAPLDQLLPLVLRADPPWWVRMHLRTQYRDAATARLVPLLKDPAHQSAAAEALRFLDTDAGRTALSKHNLSLNSY